MLLTLVVTFSCRNDRYDLWDALFSTAVQGLRTWKLMRRSIRKPRFVHNKVGHGQNVLLMSNRPLAFDIRIGRIVSLVRKEKKNGGTSKSCNFWSNFRPERGDAFTSCPSFLWRVAVGCSFGFLLLGWHQRCLIHQFCSSPTNTTIDFPI